MTGHVVFGVFKKLDVGSRVDVHLIVNGSRPVDVKGKFRVKGNGNGGCQDQPVVAVRFDDAAGTLVETSLRT